MKSFFSLLIFLFFAAILPAQTVGQYELRKRGASGFTSYGITLTNGQVIGLTADVPAAITPFPGAFSALSGIPANSSGVLTNNGSGTLSYTATTTGGNGSADSGKLVAYDASGQLFATSAALVKHPGTAGLYAQLGWSSLSFAYPSGFTGELTPATLTASRTWMLPDATGTIITTGNLTSIITTGTITSGTWNGTAIGLGYIAQGGATSGQVLSWNGSAWAPAAGGGGLTIGTTTITSGTSGRVLYNNAGTVAEMTTTGSGTVVALATSPTLVTPILGTPTSGTLTNCTGLPAASLLGGTLGGASYSITGGTVTTSAPLLDLSQTWNAGGVAFTAIKANITATAAASTSSLVDLQIGGTSKFKVVANTAAAGTQIIFSGNGASTTITQSASETSFNNGFSATLRFALSNTTTGIIGQGAPLQFGNYGSNPFTFSRDVNSSAISTVFAVDAANVWAQRNSTAAQEHRVFNTYTSSTNHEFGKLAWSGNVFSIGTVKGSGGGTARDMILVTDDTERMRVTSGGVTIGSGGAAISKVLTATASLDYDLTALTVEDKTITVTGAADGDLVVIAVPNGSVTTTAQFTAWVSAADTVTIRCRTLTTGENPASGTFRATVIKH